MRQRRLNVDLADEVLERRRQDWKPPEPKVKRGVLTIYSRLVEQAEGGATIDTKL
jgi:dihydroxy-acid dehydratase